MKVPKGQQLWVTYYDSRGNPKWVVTSTFTCDRYFLYKVDGEKLSKVKISASPADFEEEVGKI